MSGIGDRVLDQLKALPWFDKAVQEATWPPSYGYLKEFFLPIIFAAAVLFLIHYISSMAAEKAKVWSVPATVAGPGLAYRHRRYLSLLETPYEGANTIPALLDITCEKQGEKRMLGTREVFKKEMEKSNGKEIEKLTLGEYKWETFGQVHNRIINFAKGLVAMGHTSSEKVAIFAETRAEWFIALQGAMRLSSTVVTVYASLGEDALVHSLNETKVKTIVVDSKQLDKIMSVASKLETVERVIFMGEQLEKVTKPKNAPEKWMLEAFEEVEVLGSKSDAEEKLPVPSDVAVIMYTSGSTGMPKGVMMTHANLVATIAGVIAVVPNVDHNDTYIAYLPCAHVLELCAEVGLVAAGAAIGYSSPLTLIDSSNKIKKGSHGDAPVLQPTLMAGVPAILDRIRDGVLKKIHAASPTVQTLFQLAYDRCLASLEGKPFGAWLPERKLWELLVFNKIRLAVGGKVRFMLSGGAPLSSDTQRFMNICFGMPVGQGYGLTETCAGGTFTEWTDTSVGRVGPPIPCSFVKLIDWDEGGYRTTDKPYPRGEICIGGPNVTLGYYNNQKKTDEDYHTDSSGLRWFHSGDIGQFHEDGALEIVDRKKDIVKLQAGEYVSLGKVESVLQASPYVDNICLHAEATKSFAVALLVPNQQSLEEWGKKKGIESGDFAALCGNKEAEAEVLKSLTKVGKEGKLEKFEIPSKIKLLPEPWTPETNLVTAAMKLKRENVRKTFGEELKALYA